MAAFAFLQRLAVVYSLEAIVFLMEKSGAFGLWRYSCGSNKEDGLGGY
jgi:hypothetical protein